MPQLARQFGVSSLALFGSTARGQAHDGSDVDILISFNTVATSKQYFGARFYIADMIGAKCSSSRRSDLTKLPRSPATQPVATSERLYEVLRMALCQVILQEHPNVPGVGHALSLCADFKAL
jgi:predicted nucleotidyltransferase